MPPRPENAARYLPWLALVAYTAVLLGSWIAETWTPEWDGAIYVLTAESLAGGDGYTYQGEPFFLRPPGMAWLLSFFVEPGAFDPHRLNLLLGVFAAAAVVAVFLALRPLHGRWLALTVALLAGTSPIFTGALNAILSEFPFLALFFGGVALVNAATRERASPWPALLAAGALFAASLYMRTVAILVLPGVVLVCWRRKALRVPALVSVVLVGALAAPWILHSSALAAEAEVPSEQLFLHDYGTAMFRVDPGDPSSDLVDFAGWTERIRSNGIEALTDLSGLCRLDGHPALQGLFLLLVVLGWAVALRRGPSLLEWLAPIYVALVLTYFTYAVRLTAPLAPLAYLYLALALRTCAAPAMRRFSDRARWIAAAGVALALLTSNATRIELPAPIGPAKEDHFAIAAWLRENTPPDAVLLCNQAPVFELLSGRRCYTYRFLRRVGLLGRYDLDYVMFDQPNNQLLRAVQQGPTERRIIRTENGSRIPIFRLERP